MCSRRDDVLCPLAILLELDVLAGSTVKVTTCRQSCIASRLRFPFVCVSPTLAVIAYCECTAQGVVRPAWNCILLTVGEESRHFQIDFSFFFKKVDDSILFINMKKKKNFKRFVRSSSRSNIYPRSILVLARVTSKRVHAPVVTSVCISSLSDSCPHRLFASGLLCSEDPKVTREHRPETDSQLPASRAASTFLVFFPPQKLPRILSSEHFQ